MHPKLNVVFHPLSGENNLEIGVRKIRLSKSRRRMEVLLDDAAAYDALEQYEEKLRKYYRLSSIEMNFEKKTDPSERLKELTRIKLPVHSDKSSNGASFGMARDLGRAQVLQMLYGSAIRDNLVPISSINENSARVCFSGDIFSVETRDIKSRKKRTGRK